ncbi:hypothetical protein P154DRAFT_244982 [Amniculicola lignicola CBS 123094]|uniref:Uncharacterized protein n=1 Tax=Amniculicola lignicola CBS 123094 TaxID=1392246 RepID=A0A6A5WCD8_9PLEO|nr:hypothetical protein P154DRAFT_244982 [Amniculicola lignicola CBS 123094]
MYGQPFVARALPAAGQTAPCAVRQQTPTAAGEHLLARSPFSHRHPPARTSRLHKDRETYAEDSTMSSLSRRACFKCGNVGHYAGELHPGPAGCCGRGCGTPLGALVARRRCDGWCRGRATAGFAEELFEQHGTDDVPQRSARLRRGFATTASSRDTSPTAALTPGLPRPNSATTARALDTFRPTARLCA